MLVLALQQLVQLGAALDCTKYNIDIKETISLNEEFDTPPTRTSRSVLFNPCGSVEGMDECINDDHLCYVEKVEIDGKYVVTNVRPYGSVSNGATGKLSRSGGSSSASMTFSYTGSTWGEQDLQASVRVQCADSEKQSFQMQASDKLVVTLEGPHYCNTKSGKPVNPPKEDKSGSGGWGFFTWMFVLMFLAGILYAAKTVYINYAQSHGTLPIGADMSDILRDLPYLVRDAIRKIKGLFSTHGSGYAAI